MKLTLLGTGGPRPDPSRHGAATVLQIEDQYLLFDAGRGAVLQLVRAGDPWVCLGYRVEAQERVVTISGDCVACAGSDHLARRQT